MVVVCGCGGGGVWAEGRNDSIINHSIFYQPSQCFMRGYLSPFMVLGLMMSTGLFYVLCFLVSADCPYLCLLLLENSRSEAHVGFVEEFEWAFDPL